MIDQVYMHILSIAMVLLLFIQIFQIIGVFNDGEKHKEGGPVENEEEACGVNIVIKTDEAMPVPSEDIYALAIDRLESRVNMLECEHDGEMVYTKSIYSTPDETIYESKCKYCGKEFDVLLTEGAMHKEIAEYHMSKVAKKSDEGEAKS